VSLKVYVIEKLRRSKKMGLRNPQIKLKGNYFIFTVAMPLKNFR
jgi:hypothetical protein